MNPAGRGPDAAASGNPHR